MKYIKESETPQTIPPMKIDATPEQIKEFKKQAKRLKY